MNKTEAQIKSNQNISLVEEYFEYKRATKYQIRDEDYYSPEDDESDSEESRALTIKHSILSLKKMYKEIGIFPDPKYKINLKTKGLTSPEKCVLWWNEKHPDCQITVDSIERWTYREDEDSSRYNVHWNEYGN